MRHERMRREDLEHLVRAAGTIIRDDHLVVIGSQSVHATFDDNDLPAEAMFSMEADLLPNDDPETKKADLIDGVLGEDSLFHETFGYYAQGVDQHTAVLPNGWKDRLRPLSNANTRGVTGWCLEPHDLAVAKLAAGRPKDYEFVGALVRAHLLDPVVIRQRIRETTMMEGQRRAAGGFLDRLTSQ